jgi:hypothetical protein
MSSFLYPRTVSVFRLQTNETPGAQPYSGTTKGAETLIVSGLPASIQFTRKSGSPLGGTPSDAPNKAGFNIMIPLSAAANGTITERDIIVDDLGKRYEVFGAYWNSLGFNLQTELLQA